MRIKVFVDNQHIFTIDDLCEISYDTFNQTDLLKRVYDAFRRNPVLRKLESKFDRFHRHNPDVLNLAILDSHGKHIICYGFITKQPGFSRIDSNYRSMTCPPEIYLYPVYQFAAVTPLTLCYGGDDSIQIPSDKLCSISTGAELQAYLASESKVSEQIHSKLSYYPLIQDLLDADALEIDPRSNKMRLGWCHFSNEIRMSADEKPLNVRELRVGPLLKAPDKRSLVLPYHKDWLQPSYRVSIGLICEYYMGGFPKQSADGVPYHYEYETGVKSFCVSLQQRALQKDPEIQPSEENFLSIVAKAIVYYCNDTQQPGLLTASPIVVAYADMYQETSSQSSRENQSLQKDPSIQEVPFIPYNPTFFASRIAKELYNQKVPGVLQNIMFEYLGVSIEQNAIARVVEQHNNAMSWVGNGVR